MAEGSLLGSLIAPLTSEELLATWNRRPLHVPANQNAAKRTDLFAFSSAEFRRAAGRIPAAAAARVEYGQPALSALGFGGQGLPLRPIFADQVDATYAAGLTCSLGGLQFLHGPCGVAADRLRRELNHAGNVNMYAFLSPRGSGARMHFDRSPSLTIQLEGSKTWRYSKAPAMEEVPDQATLAKLDLFRHDHPWASVSPPRADELTESTLYPGDVLHVPAGTWHEASAGDHSLAIAIELDKRPLADVLAARLRRLLATHAEWRRTPPPVDAGSEDAQSVVDAYAAASEGRLKELQEIIASFGAAGLVSACYPQLFGDAEEPASEAPADSGASFALSPDDELTVPSPLSWGPGIEDDGTHFVLLSSSEASASVGLGALPLVHRLLELTAFRACEAQSWFPSDAVPPWNELEAALGGLLTARILARR